MPSEISLADPVRRVGRRLFTLFFPASCDLCGEELSDGDPVRVCRRCIGHLAHPEGAERCGACDHPLEQGECAACTVNALSLSRCRCLFQNAGVGKEFLNAYKFQRRRSYAPILAERIMETFGPWVKEHDLIVPIPISRSAHWERDFCPVTEPVKRLSRLCGVPWAPVLVKRRSGLAQHLRRRADRKRQDEARFRVDLERFPSGVEKILLVDDILTTGSTLNQGADLLREARDGVSVRGLAFGRTLLRA